MLEMLHLAAVGFCRMLFDTRSPAAVGELEDAIRGRDTCDYASTSPPFAGRCGYDGPAAWYQYHGIVLWHIRTSSTSELLRLRGLPRFVILGRIRPVLPEKWMSCDFEAVVVDTFQRTDVQRLYCYPLLLRTVMSYLSSRRMNTPHSAPFFGT
jgi:hypothetical protein